jgi:hypothetical protein
VKGKITGEPFDARHVKLAGELRDPEALLLKPQPVIDPKIQASAIAGPFAEFPLPTAPGAVCTCPPEIRGARRDRRRRIETAVMRGKS